MAKLLILLLKIDVIEKDLFSFAAWKRAGAHESASRKLMRSLSELNRRYRGWEGMYFECRD